MYLLAITCKSIIYKSDLFQARTQQLLQQNRELLEHIAALGGYHEPDRPNLTATSIGMAPQVGWNSMTGLISTGPVFKPVLIVSLLSSVH